MEGGVGVPSLTPPSPPKEVSLGSPRDMAQASLSGLHSLGLGPHLLMFTFLSPQRRWTTSGLGSFGTAPPTGDLHPWAWVFAQLQASPLRTALPSPSPHSHLPTTATHLSAMVLGPALGLVHTPLLRWTMNPKPISGTRTPTAGPDRKGHVTFSLHQG